MYIEYIFTVCVSIVHLLLYIAFCKLNVDEIQNDDLTQILVYFAGVELKKKICFRR